MRLGNTHRQAVKFAALTIIAIAISVATAQAGIHSQSQFPPETISTSPIRLLPQEQCEVDPQTGDRLPTSQTVFETTYQRHWLTNRGSSSNLWLTPSETDSVNSWFSTGLVIGATVNSDTLVSSARFGNRNFNPGPILADGNPADDCERFDRIWDFGISDHGRPDYFWPSELGAPLFEETGKAALYGSYSKWSIMNDLSYRGQEWEAGPLGAEVRILTYAFDDAVPTPLGRESSLFPQLRNTVFTRYEITNRSEDTWISFRAGLSNDTDIGSYYSNYFGTDSLRSMGYIYDALESDPDWPDWLAPPAIGYILLNDLSSLEDGIDNDGNGLIDDDRDIHALWASLYQHRSRDSGRYNYLYNWLGGTYRNGQPMVYGNFPDDWTDVPDVSGTPSRHTYTGDPVTGENWSALNTDGNGTAGQASDVRGFYAIRPRDVAPGETVTFFAVQISGLGSSNLDSITDLRRKADLILRYSDTWLQPTNPVDAEFSELPDIANPKLLVQYFNSYPQPASDRATIHVQINLPARAKLEMFDIMGRRVESILDQTLEAGSKEFPLDLSNRSPGVYFLRLSLYNQVHTKGIIVAR